MTISHQCLPPLREKRLRNSSITQMLQIQVNEVYLQMHNPSHIGCLFGFIPRCYKLAVVPQNAIPLYNRGQQGRLAVKHDRTP
jgi:hypothetical protein